MRNILTSTCAALIGATLATSVAAQAPAEFDPADFGKIVVQPRQSTNGLTFEQAIGDYQNEPIVQYGENSPAVRLGRPIGRLDMLFDNGKTGFCTAFIVDESHIITNHHCIPGMDGDPSGKDSGIQAAQFVAGYIKPGRSAGVDRYTISPQIVETNRELDYTVLRVFGNPSGKYGFLELAAADPEDAEFLWIIGHPQGQSQHISREGCAAASPSISDEGKLVHTCDTLGGNSGSPVIRISDKRVIGLHHAGDSISGFNMAIPMTRILAQSKVLKAAAGGGNSSVGAPRAPQQVSACDALWTEAKALGCGGYEAYVAECGNHTFSGMAEALIKRECTVPDRPPVITDAKPDLPEHDGPVFSVRTDGGGDYRSITDAVTQSPAGSQIRIFPGTYVEGLDISKPMELVGVGNASDIVLRVAEDHVIHWTANSGRISNLSVVQDGGSYFGIFFDSGTATMEDTDVTSTGLAAVGIRQDSNPILRRNRIHHAAQGGVFIYDGADALIENNEVYENTFAGIEIKSGSDPVVRNNLIRDGQSSGVYVHTEGRGRIENNEITRNTLAAVEISGRSDPVVIGNDIHHGKASGVYVQDNGLGLVENNTFNANALSAVSITSGGDPVVRNNTMRAGKESGVYVYDGGKGRIESNVIETSGFAGVAVKGGSNPMVVGNTIRNGKQSGVFIYEGGLGVFEDNVIEGNAYYGLEVKTDGNPTVRNNRFVSNVWHAFRVYEGGRGVYENNDLSANAAGDFDIDDDAGAFTRSGNR
ncbi:right-handed parallel beta-helix repeat-containing protein [Cognatishimia sp. F0-27]|uniref:right-handed parallel beta-helix repeat-containing protein n=1 Tax=Cognatishimia sp. F0-27 TaxID=2816855 RepID=UPI001D0C369B|nr:right-handed parallel beta-helix repeat-containing protein [Cognatishimia sp. F0-27]MCC1493341.1 right-handed parallel beta-helix repeat-containing protein [Cognatishimia sp. F0-27]